MYVYQKDERSIMKLTSLLENKGSLKKVVIAPCTGAPIPSTYPSFFVFGRYTDLNPSTS